MPRVIPEPVYFPPPPAPPRVVHLKSFNRLAELVPLRRGLKDVLRGGAVSPFVGTPAGVAFLSGHLYICDTDSNVVHAWNLATGQARRIGNVGEIQLAKPVAVAVDEEGTVYVADTGRSEVIAFGPVPERPTRRFRPPDRTAYRPVAVAVEKGVLYVADIAAHRIDIFSADEGTYQGHFGGTGSEPGRLYFPTGLAITSDGTIVVSEMMNARVQIFESGYQSVLTMGKPGNRYGDMGKPKHLAVGPDGTVFIADPGFAHVHLFNTKGELLMLLGGPERGIGGTPMPVGVAVAPTLPNILTSLVPDDFDAGYYVFVTNSVGDKRVSLFAVGTLQKATTGN